QRMRAIVRRCPFSPVLVRFGGSVDEPRSKIGLNWDWTGIGWRGECRQERIKKAKAIMWRSGLLAVTVSAALFLPAAMKADDEPGNKPPPTAVPTVPRGDDEPEDRPTEGRRRGQLSEGQKALRK